MASEYQSKFTGDQVDESVSISRGMLTGNFVGLNVEFQRIGTTASQVDFSVNIPDKTRLNEEAVIKDEGNISAVRLDKNGNLAVLIPQEGTPITDPEIDVLFVQNK